MTELRRRPAYTIAGPPYAGAWIAVGVARLLFAYESTHSVAFGRAHLPRGRRAGH